jgi:hypothetical protein
MDIGSGIAIGSGVAGILAAFYKVCEIKYPPKNDNGDSVNGVFAGKHCLDHSGVVACLDGIEEGQKRHEGWLKEISADVKSLLKR